MAETDDDNKPEELNPQEANALENTDQAEVAEEEEEEEEEEEDDAIPKARKTIGWRRFRTLRALWDIVVNGDPIPKRLYSFRVDQEKLDAAAEYLMAVLHVLPGRCRSVKLDKTGPAINNLPVYDRGGHSINDLFSRYQNDVGRENAIGYPTFASLVKLLTKKGEAKTGLSAYYTRFRHACSTYDEIFDFLKSLEEVQEVDGIEILSTDDGATQKVPANVDELKKRFDTEVKRFVSYEFGNDHVNLQSMERCHCARDALNKDIPPVGRQRVNRGDDGRCSNEHCGLAVHEHSDLACEQCVKLFSFSTEAGPLAQLLDKVDESWRASGTTLEGENKKRYDSIRQVLPKLQHEIVRYAGHHVRWKVQRTGYSKLMCDLEPDEAIVILDHKQKIIAIRNREGMIEYFGKKGMSFCGANIIRKVERDGVVGYEHHYFDFIIDGYQDQDHVQVAAIIQVMLDEIKKKFPELKRIILKTDTITRPA